MVTDADYEIHHCIFKLAGHGRLQSHYLLVEPQTRLFLRLSAALEYKLSTILRIHEEWVNAIKRGDAVGAFALANEHNTPDGQRIMQLPRGRGKTLP